MLKRKKLKTKKPEKSKSKHPALKVTDFIYVMKDGRIIQSTVSSESKECFHGCLYF
jgi:hypothetical protein